MGVYFTVSSQNQPLTNDFMSTLNPYVLTARFLLSHLNSTIYLPSSMSQTSSYTHTAAYSERLPMSTEERPAPRGGRGGQRGRGRGRSTSASHRGHILAISLDPIGMFEVLVFYLYTTYIRPSHGYKSGCI